MAAPYVLLLTRLIAEVTSKSTESLVSQPECCMDVLDANSTCPVTNQCSPGCYRQWNDDGSSSCIKCKNETPPVVSISNLTDCRNTGTRGMNFQMNISTVTPFLQNIGGPEVAASLILGTFFISLFLILSVASFFYLKRANKLPSMFYRRNKGLFNICINELEKELDSEVVKFADDTKLFKIVNSKADCEQLRRDLTKLGDGNKMAASVLQPSETASMIPPPTSSVRKPRYVRRERSLVMSASAAMIPSAETRVSNV